MNMSRLGINDILNWDKPTGSEYVVVFAMGQPSDGWNAAQHGNYLTAIGHDHYKVKRIVANNLRLDILCDWPMVAK